MTIRRRYEQQKAQEYYPSDSWWAVVLTSNEDIGTLLDLLAEAIHEHLDWDNKDPTPFIDKVTKLTGIPKWAMKEDL